MENENTAGHPVYKFLMDRPLRVSSFCIFSPIRNNLVDSACIASFGMLSQVLDEVSALYD